MDMAWSWLMLMVLAPCGAGTAPRSSVTSPGSVASVGGLRSAEDFGTEDSSTADGGSRASSGRPSINRLLFDLALGLTVFLATRGIGLYWRITDPGTRPWDCRYFLLVYQNKSSVQSGAVPLRTCEGHFVKINTAREILRLLREHVAASSWLRQHF